MLRELDAARTETEGTIKRQREFVADACHELRTPLTSILANLELLERRARGRIDEDDTRGGRLGAAQLEADEPAGRRPAAARPRRRRAGRQRGPSATSRAIAARGARGGRRRSPTATSSPPGSTSRVPVDGNPDELHRMVLNLLENAIRHTPAGHDGSGCASTAAGDRAKLVVADDGPGLPEGMEDQVFERFVRGEGPADRSSAQRHGHRPRALDRAGRRRRPRRAGGRRPLQARRRPLHRDAAARGRARRRGEDLSELFRCVEERFRTPRRIFAADETTAPRPLPHSGRSAY